MKLKMGEDRTTFQSQTFPQKVPFPHLGKRSTSYVNFKNEKKISGGRGRNTGLRRKRRRKNK